MKKTTVSIANLLPRNIPRDTAAVKLASAATSNRRRWRRRRSAPQSVNQVNCWKDILVWFLVLDWMIYEGEKVWNLPTAVAFGGQGSGPETAWIADCDAKFKKLIQHMRIACFIVIPLIKEVVKRDKDTTACESKKNAMRNPSTPLSCLSSCEQKRLVSNL